MKILIRVIAVLGLLLTIVPAVLVFQGAIVWKTHAQLMSVGMVLWFMTAPSIMKKKDS